MPYLCIVTSRLSVAQAFFDELRDPNLSLGDPGTSPSQSHNVESLQSQIAQLKRQLKSREQRYRTATIVSAEAAECDPFDHLFLS